MTRPIAPKHAQAIAKASQQRLANRITANTHAAIAALHDNQPGYPTGGDGTRSGGGHSDPTANLAMADDQARNVLEEVTRLFCDLDRITDRLAVLVPSWANANEKWQESLRTEAAAKLGDEHNWCASHQRAGLLEPAQYANGVQCRWCKDYSRDLGGDPPDWMIEKHDRGKPITTMDMAKAKRDLKAKRKGKRR